MMSRLLFGGHQRGSQMIPPSRSSLPPPPPPADPESFLSPSQMKACFLSVRIVQGFIYHAAAEYAAA